jgi:beta-glucosidase
MPDLLHPNEKGYEIWADAMEPTLAKLLGEK